MLHLLVNDGTKQSNKNLRKFAIRLSKLFNHSVLLHQDKTRLLGSETCEHGASMAVFHQEVSVPDGFRPTCSRTFFRSRTAFSCASRAAWPSLMAANSLR